MTSGTLNAPRAVRHSIVQPTGKLMLGMLLSSVSTGAFAQGAQPANPPVVTVAPGSTTAQSTEQATQANTGTTPPAPQADDVGRPQTGSTVVENASQAPQDTGSGLGAIIVTATKRETNLQKTPIAISVANSSGARPTAMPTACLRPRRRLDPQPARRDLRGAPFGADRRHPRHRPVRPEPDRPRPGRRRLYRRRLSRPPAGPQCRAVRHRADRGAARPAGHAVRPQHRRRRGQHHHPGADRRVRHPRHRRRRQFRRLQRRASTSTCRQSPTSRSRSTA